VVALSIAIGIGCAGGIWGEIETIGPDDWEFQELDALAQVGLLSGHPKGPVSNWTDRLTRYEAASMTLRAVEGVADAYREQGEALRQSAQAGAEPEGPRPTSTPVTMADLARVEKLIQEFRAELVTMGVRVDDLETALADIDHRLSKVEAERKRVHIRGFVQLRYEDDDASGENPSFAVRRARFNIEGSVAPRVSYRLEFQGDAALPGEGAGTTTQLSTAYMDYTSRLKRLRLGQAKVPWGYELETGATDLWTSERAYVMDELFPSQRDIGLQGSFRASDAYGSPQIDIGLFNGTGINTEDNNSRKNPMIRLKWPTSTGSVALSAYRGTDGEGPSATRQDRYGIGAELGWPDGTEFVGEYVRGKNLGADVEGWYAQVGRPIRRDLRDLAFLKYDVYDEDLDAPNDRFKRWSLGYWWDPQPPVRVRLVYEVRRPDSAFSEFGSWESDRWYTEMQLVY
jgi:hypothetical protein